MSTQQDNAQDPNNPPADGASPTAQDPTTLAQPPADPAPEGPVAPGHRTPGFPPSQEPPGAETNTAAPEDTPTGEDPHEVRTRLALRGAVHGLELDTGTGVVFIPQYALPDLRRRLLLAQERFTTMNGPARGKRRRRPASAR